MQYSFFFSTSRGRCPQGWPLRQLFEADGERWREKDRKEMGGRVCVEMKNRDGEKRRHG